MSQDTILIACALRRETKRLRRRLTEEAVRSRDGSLEFDFRHTGVGVHRSEERLTALLSERRPRLLIFTGTAGGLDPSLSMGQVVLPRGWRFEEGSLHSHDEAVLAGAAAQQQKLQPGLLTLTDLGLTVARPVLLPSARNRLYQQTGAAVCDMECAAALRTAARLQVPALALKVVSDTAQSGLTDFWMHLHSNLDRLALTLRSLIPLLLDTGF